MHKTKTTRGFDIIKFVDDYGEECSLQKSSSADADRVWLGVSSPTCMVIASKHRDLAEHRTDVDPSERFNGWMDYPLPPDCSIPTRMHLNRSQAKKLAKALKHFAKHGRLP